MTDSNGVHADDSAVDVFQRVAARLEANEAARSLWLKLEQEMTAGGVSSAKNYVHTRFKDLSDRITAALPHGDQD